MKTQNPDMNGYRRWLRMSLLACGVALSPACTPALNWRTVAVASGDANAMFPCRPDDVERPIRLADRAATMRLMACRAADSTYALAVVDVSDGFAVEPMLDELRVRSTANIGGHEQTAGKWFPKGAQPGGERVTVVGQWPNGTALVEERAMTMAHGKIYRLSVIGDAPPRDVDYFFAGFTVVP